MAVCDESASRRRKTRKSDMRLAAAWLPPFKIYRCIRELVSAST